MNSGDTLPCSAHVTNSGYAVMSPASDITATRLFEVQAKPQIVGIGIEIVLCQQIVVRVFAKVMFEQR
jgi:hypothetical protein